VDYRILGSFEVSDGGAPVTPGTGRQRALLALLLLRPNETVQSETLVDELWESPPPSATKILQNYVSQLRRTLGDGVLVTRGRGYALRVEPGEVDVDRFVAQLEIGRRALATNDPELAAATLRAALELWRGPPLVDFADERFAQADIDRLEELRLAALTERIEADLALGRHAELIGELDVLARRYPFQERLCAQRMLALYRSGRQAEALEAYRATRHSLNEEMGIDPGGALQALERAILTQDPALDLPPARTGSSREGVGERSRRSRRFLAAGIVALTAIVGAAAWLLLLDGRESAGVVDPAYSVGVVDPESNEIVDRIEVGLLPSAVATGAGNVFVLNQGETTVSKIDATTHRVTRTIPLTETANEVGATAIAFGHGAAWIGDGNAATVSRVDSAQVRSDPPVRIHPRFESDVLLIATDATAVWVVSARRSTIYKLDPVSTRTLSRARVPATPIGVAAGRGAVWMTSIRPVRTPGTIATSGALTRIDPATLAVVSEASLPFTPSGLAVGFGAVWVAVNSQNAVLRIDPRTSSVETTIVVGDGPNALAVGSDAIWVVNAKGLTLSRVDPKTNKVVATVRLSGTPGAIASGGGKIWVTGL
jgi:DNA-binding SARP family transcriptional activator/DNA-binding beta-propeller fold protein YncE